MQTSTGAWQALPEMPWGTRAGASYKDLGRKTARLLADIHAKFANASTVELALLADQLSDLRVDLRDLAQSELVADAFHADAQASVHRGRHTVPRDHLRLLPDPDRDINAPAPLRQLARGPHQVRP